MRMHDRLVVLIALVLLTGVLSARTAQPAGVGFQPGAAPAQPSLRSNTPPRVQFDFGTVVRDTADGDGIRPGPGGMPAGLMRQAPQDMSWWNRFFSRDWLGVLLALR